MAAQQELFREDLATVVANMFTAQLEADDIDPDVALAALLITMRSVAVRQDSFARLRITGVGDMRQAFVWWMADDSVLVIGTGVEDENEIHVGVLGAGSKFTPVPYDEASDNIATLH